MCCKRNDFHKYENSINRSTVVPYNHNQQQPLTHHHHQITHQTSQSQTNQSTQSWINASTVSSPPQSHRYKASPRNPQHQALLPMEDVDPSSRMYIPKNPSASNSSSFKSGRRPVQYQRSTSVGHHDVSHATHL